MKCIKSGVVSKIDFRLPRCRLYLQFMRHPVGSAPKFTNINSHYGICFTFNQDTLATQKKQHTSHLLPNTLVHISSNYKDVSATNKDASLLQRITLLESLNLATSVVYEMVAMKNNDNVSLLSGINDVHQI